MDGKLLPGILRMAISSSFVNTEELRSTDYQNNVFIITYFYNTAMFHSSGIFCYGILLPVTCVTRTNLTNHGSFLTV